MKGAADAVAEPPTDPVGSCWTGRICRSLGIVHVWPGSEYSPAASPQPESSAPHPRLKHTHTTHTPRDEVALAVEILQRECVKPGLSTATGCSRESGLTFALRLEQDVLLKGGVSGVGEGLY